MLTIMHDQLIIKCMVFINIKMPISVDILTCFSRINYIINKVSKKKAFFNFEEWTNYFCTKSVLQPQPGAGCSKLTTSLVKVTSNFTM